MFANVLHFVIGVLFQTSVIVTRVENCFAVFSLSRVFLVVSVTDFNRLIRIIEMRQVNGVGIIERHSLIGRLILIDFLNILEV